VVNKTPAVEPVQPKDDSVSLEPAAKPTRRMPRVSTTLIRRNPSENRATANQRRETQTAVNQALSRIQNNLSGSTEIELKGPGGGGLPYANFLAAVKKVYTDAWLLPDGITDDSATVTASITIARDGTVVSAYIVSRSGNADVNQSVQMALDRVKYAAPLPDDSNDNQRTVTINFNVKAKLLG
jgi:TonB family protein